jgi:T-complex protein 1 subunit alpha
MRLTNKLSVTTISSSSRDARSLTPALLSLEEPTSTCWTKSKGKYLFYFRSLHDSICVAKRTLESGKIVPGGGAVDIALSIHLDKFCRTFATKEQIAISEFSEALNIIPKTLSVNAAKDATELISKLRTLHTASQKEGEDDEKKLNLKYCGLDLVNGKPRNNLKAGVLEPMISKINSIRFATEAAITILRIDDMIKLVPEQQQQPGH